MAVRPREAWAQFGIISSFSILNAWRRRLFFSFLSIILPFHRQFDVTAVLSREGCGAVSPWLDEGCPQGLAAEAKDISVVCGCCVWLQSMLESLCVNSYFALFQSTVGVPLGVRECVYINPLLFFETKLLKRKLCCTAELGSPAFTRHVQWH